MDVDRKELVRRLSTLATELVEDAHEAAIEGQSAELQAQDYAGCARRLQSTGRQIAAIAETMMIVVYDAELALHPTVKPVALVADAILDCSKRRGIVLDAFTGSPISPVTAPTGRSSSSAWTGVIWPR